jgi:hypothetical protein
MSQGHSRFVERLLLRATREVHFLAALTPTNAKRERARLVEAVRARRVAVPRWSYAPVAHDELRRSLCDAACALAKTSTTPLDALQQARAHELSVEAALCAAAGTGDVARLAGERFPMPEERVARAASALCAKWLAESPQPPEAEEPLVESDSDDPRSLLSRMRARICALRLPFSVVARSALAPLAATGERVILIATGRLLGRRDTVRTVLHEIEGHARPRARAGLATLALFRVGTARGTDDQEGRALLIEERARLLDAPRRRQLAARHCCVEAMRNGGKFDDVARMLVDKHAIDASDAVIVAERAFRGSDGMRIGLGRERVYLESFVRVRAHLERRPEVEAVLACGQVAVDAAAVLAQFPFRLPR